MWSSLKWLPPGSLWMLVGGRYLLLQSQDVGEFRVTCQGYAISSYIVTLFAKNSTQLHILYFEKYWF